MTKKTQKESSPLAMRGVNNLVQTWIYVERNIYGNSLNQAIERLNNALDSAHTNSRVHEWAKQSNSRGLRLPRTIRLYMGKRVIKQVLANSGVATEQLSTHSLNKLVERLS